MKAQNRLPAETVNLNIGGWKFHELGIQLSRAIQGRDPLTGEEVRGGPL